MSVKQDIVKLLQLQGLDLKTRDIRTELADIPKHNEEIRTNVEAMSIILQKERDRLAEAEEWRKSKESEIELQNDLQAKSKVKLQGARNEKESKAAQREIDTIKKNITDHEKELIELMDAIEQYRTAMAAHEKEFAELEEHLALSEKEGEERSAEIRTILEGSDKEREELSSTVSQQYLRLYERILKRHPNPIVEVSEPFCSGCNFQIRPQEYNDLIRGEKFIKCANCMRIFVYNEPAEETGDTSE